MTKLYYITTSYPYGTGEKPFVKLEIEYFSRIFDLTVVSMAPEKLVNSKAHESLLPEKVKLVCCGKRRWLRELLSVLAFSFTKTGRQENKRIWRSGSKRLGRLLHCMRDYAWAQSMRLNMKKAGVFDKVGNSIYYTFWFNEIFLACALEKTKQPSMKLASRIHGYDLYNERTPWHWQPMREFSIASVNVIVFLTEKAKSYFISSFCDEETARQKVGDFPVCALGSSPAKGIPTKAGDDVFRIVSCSNAVPLKRVELIIEALSLLDDSKIEWIHFGDGPKLESLKRLASEKGINAIFKGFTQNEEILDFYAQNYVDLFITTSSTEGLPVSIQESMAFCIPVIGTDVGGISEEIDGNGTLLPANPSIKEVAEAILHIKQLSDKEVASMRNRSQQLWAEKFDAGNSLLKMKSLFDRIMDSDQNRESESEANYER